MESTLLIILLGLFFICGAPLFTIMLGATALGALFSDRGFDISFDGAINKLFGTSGRDEMEVLSTIPLFIYAGYLLAEAKTADRLVRFANALMGWVPGGLAFVTIWTCALFTVFTGASGVTIIALGGVLMPALVRNGYPERFSLGLIAGTGSVGLLLPPALPLFIYGTVYGLVQSEEEKAAGVWSTERFLFAGVLPGFLLIGLLCAVAFFVAIRKKLPTQKFVAGELGKSFLLAIPELMIPFGVIALLASGFGLPEVAALTVAYVLILEAIVFTPFMRAAFSKVFRRSLEGWPQSTIGPKSLWAISFEAMAMIGAIFMIILASTALTDFMVNAEVPRKMVDWTTSHVESKIVFLLAINVILLIVGTVMDIFSAIVVVVPLIAPIARQYGIDPYHLGVIFLLNLEVGYLHPPVGLNLFLTSVKFQRPITEVMWATIPFLVTMIVALFIITYVPEITTKSVPPAKRTDPVMNLAAIAKAGIEESKVTITQVTLVDASGKPLIGANKKPIVRKFSDCRALLPAEEGKPAKPPSDAAVRDCQKLFFDLMECAPEPKTTDPKKLACRHKATAKWAVKRFEDFPHEAVIITTSAALVDDAGAALALEEEVLGPDGKPIVDPIGNTEKKSVPLVAKDGKPITLTLDWCKKLEFKSDSEKCKGLFISLTGCRINFEPPESDCIEEAGCGKTAPDGAGSGSGSGAGSGSGSATGSGSGSATGSGSGTGGGGAGAGPTPGTGKGDATPVDCRANAETKCTEKQITKCVVDATKSWVDDNPTIAKNPKLK